VPCDVHSACTKPRSLPVTRGHSCPAADVSDTALDRLPKLIALDGVFEAAPSSAHFLRRVWSTSCTCSSTRSRSVWVRGCGADDVDPTRLALTEHDVYDNGVVHLGYRPTDLTWRRRPTVRLRRPPSVFDAHRAHDLSHRGTRQQREHGDAYLGYTCATDREEKP
jgi:hypothetical protein